MEPTIPLSRLKWDENDALVVRQLFATDVGQKLLKMLRQNRPTVTAKLSDDRRTEHETRHGYERCFEELIRLIGPQNA